MIEVRFSTQNRQVPIDEIKEHISTENDVIWLDVQNPTENDTSFLEKIFGLHPLALEDTVNQNQRPKVEEFHDHLFIIVNVFHAGYEDDPFRELDLFVGKNYFVTLHKDDETALESLSHRIKTPSINFKMSTTFLLYSLLDEVVDRYHFLLESIEDELNTLSSLILQKTDKSMLTRLFAIQQLLGQVNRVLHPHLDIVNTLTSHEMVFIEKDSLYHLRDVSDHLLRFTDLTRQLRETTSNLLNLYVSAESNQLNKNVTRLTLLTISIGLLTIISGFYGMNFNSTFPPFTADWGVWFVAALMLLIGVAGIISYRWQ